MGIFCIFYVFLSHLSLHDEPDGERDVRRVLSGLTVEGSHHDVVRRERERERVMTMMRFTTAGEEQEEEEMEERAVAAEVRRGQLGVTRDRAVRVQQPGNTTIY